jgi:hypothetical protein
MTRPVTSEKVVLIEDPRRTSAEPDGAPLRRYRLARLRLDGRSQDPGSRFEHLSRVYD